MVSPFMINERQQATFDYQATIIKQEDPYVSVSDLIDIDELVHVANATIDHSIFNEKNTKPRNGIDFDQSNVELDH